MLNEYVSGIGNDWLCILNHTQTSKTFSSTLQQLGPLEPTQSTLLLQVLRVMWWDGFLLVQNELQTIFSVVAPQPLHIQHSSMLPTQVTRLGPTLEIICFSLERWVLTNDGLYGCTCFTKCAECRALSLLLTAAYLNARNLGKDTSREDTLKVNHQDEMTKSDVFFVSLSGTLVWDPLVSGTRLWFLYPSLNEVVSFCFAFWCFVLNFARS